MANVLQWAGRAVGSLKEAWDELLHPRGPDGRFIKKWGMGEKAARQVVDVLAKARVRTFPSDGAAGQYAFNQHHKASKPGWNQDRFVRDFDGVNEALRAGRTDAVTSRYTKMMDDSGAPLEDDLIVTKMVSPEAFGLGPDAFTPKPLEEDPQRMVTDVENLTGKLIGDRGYTSGGIGTEYNNPAGANKIRMIMLVPKGTKALFPGSSQTDRQIVLDKDQEQRVTNVLPDGQGGFHVYTVATPRTPGATPEPADLGAGQPGKAIPQPGKVTMTPEQMVSNLTSLKGRDLKDRAANVGVDATGTDAEISNRIRQRAKEALKEAKPAPGAGFQPAPAETPAQAPAAPAPAQAPAAPAAPAAPGAPAPRTEQVQSEAMGGGAPAVPGAAPAAPGAAPGAAPEAPAEPRMSGRHFTQLVRDNQLPMPSAGPRRREYNQALLGIGSGKKEPADMLRELDTDIDVNRRRLEADPDGDAELERDIDAQNQLADLIAQSYDLERRQAPAPAAPPPAPARPAKVVPEPVIQAPPPRPIQETTARSFKEEQARRRAARGAETVTELPEAPPEEAPAPVKKAVKKAAPEAAARPPSTLRQRALDSLAEQGIENPRPEMIREQMRALRDIEASEAVRARSGGGAPAKKAAPRKAAPGKLQRLQAAEAGDIDAMTKQELLAEAKKRDVNVATSWTKDRIKQALRGEGEAPKKRAPRKQAPIPGTPEFEADIADDIANADRWIAESGVNPANVTDLQVAALRLLSNDFRKKKASKAAGVKRMREIFGGDENFVKILDSIDVTPAKRAPAKKAAPKAPEITDQDGEPIKMGDALRARGGVGEVIEVDQANDRVKLRWESGENAVGETRMADIWVPTDEVSHHGAEVKEAAPALPKRTPGGTPTSPEALARRTQFIGMAGDRGATPPAASEARNKAETDFANGRDPKEIAAELRSTATRINRARGGQANDAEDIKYLRDLARKITAKPAATKAPKAATKADLQKQADDLGLKYRKADTKAQLEEMIANAPKGAKRDTTKDLPKEAIRGDERLNEARGAEFADAWEKKMGTALFDDPDKNASLQEIVDGVRAGDLTPSDGLRRLENEIEFNGEEITDLSRQLRANPEDKTLARKLRRVQDEQTAQIKASNFFRDHFKNEPSVTDAELAEVKSDVQVGRDLAAAVGGIEPKTLGDMLKAAKPEDADELRQLVNADPNLGPAKGDTAEEIFDNAIKEMIRKKLAGEFDKPAKKVQAPERPAGKPLNTPDVREIAAGLEVPEHILNFVQNELDDPKKTPASVGRALDNSPVGPSVRLGYLSGIQGPSSGSEFRDPKSPFYNPERVAQVDAEIEKLRHEANQVKQLAERLKVTRRKRATAPKPETPKLTPEDNKLAKRASEITGVPEAGIKRRLVEEKEDKAPASDHAKGVADLLNVAASREEGHALLAKKTKAELKDIAKASKVAVGSNWTSQKMKDEIVQTTVGRRLVSEAISGREAGSALRGQAAPEVLEVDYTDPALLQSGHAQDILANLEHGDSREDLIGMYIEDGIAPDMATMLVDEVIKARDVQAAEKAKAGRVELNPTMPLRDVVRQLQAEWENPRSREEVATLLVGRKRAELVETAKELSIPGAGGLKVEDLRTQIVQATVGRRLDSIATRGFKGTRPEQPFLPGQASKKAAPEVPKADETVPLRGDPEGDNMRMHGDSLTMNLAQAYAKAGRNGSANRMMDLRYRSTAREGGITPQQTVDELKEILAQEQDPVFKRQLERAIEGIDAPMTPLPDLPENTPPAARKLIEDLHAIPYARKGKGEPIGTGGVIRGDSLVDQLAQVYRDAAAQRRGESGRSPSDRVRKILREQVHEVNEAAFRIWDMERLLDSKEGKPSPLTTELRLWERGQLPEVARPKVEAPKEAGKKILGNTPQEISRMRITELKTLAMRLGIQGWEDMKKDELLDAILGEE